MNKLAITIRTKKLAVLIRDARLASGRLPDECASALGVSREEFDRYERGEAAPSLPELEALAYFLDVPVSHFWGSSSLSESSSPAAAAERIARSIEARRQAIGDALREMREEGGRSQEDVASASGFAVEELAAYEGGTRTIPAPHLELLVAELGGSIHKLTGGDGPVGEWIREQNNMGSLRQMPLELQDFVCKPYNRPYLEIAQRLSTMEVGKLRKVAEGLLEITL